VLPQQAVAVRASMQRVLEAESSLLLPSEVLQQSSLGVKFDRSVFCLICANVLHHEFVVEHVQHSLYITTYVTVSNGQLDAYIVSRQTVDSACRGFTLTQAKQ
jgi:hypothetical protein